MVAKAALPIDLERYLRAASDVVTELYRPTWIKGPLDGDRIEIDFEETSAHEERRSAVKLPTRLYAPPGRLTPARAALFRRHMLLVLISFIDGAISPSRTTQACQVIWNATSTLVEYWLCIAPEERLDRGISGIPLDALVEVLELYRQDGKEGVLDLRGAWESAIEAKCIAYSEDLVGRIEDALDDRVRALIQRRIAEVKATNTGGPFRENLQTIIVILVHEAAYDNEGLIRSDYISRLLGVPPRRASRNLSLQYHLRAYSIADNFDRQNFQRYGVRSERNILRSTLEDRQTSGKPYRLDVLAAGLKYLSLSAGNVAELSRCEIADSTRALELIDSVNRPDAGRTATIPASTALTLVRKCVEWLVYTAPDLEKLCAHLAATPFKKSADGRPLNFAPTMSRAIAGLRHPLLERHGVAQFAGGARACRPNWTRPQSAKDRPLAFSDLLDIHSAVCFCLVVLLACLRNQEALDLRDGDLIGGRLPKLDVGLRKRKVDQARLRRRKPIPRVAARAIESLIKIRDIWKSCLPTSRGGRSYVFAYLTRSGVSGSADKAIRTRTLDLLSEYFDLRFPSGERWYVRAHQLRKCFAMTFFHNGGHEQSLPALTWFMGHGTVKETWRYIRSELTGSEITTAEAQLATRAVLSAEKSSSVKKLRELLLRHFNCQTLSVMNESDLQLYLEFLHRKGAFTASPIEIRVNGGRRVTVMIKIDERVASCHV